MGSFEVEGGLEGGEGFEAFGLYRGELALPWGGGGLGWVVLTWTTDSGVDAQWRVQVDEGGVYTGELDVDAAVSGVRAQEGDTIRPGAAGVQGRCARDEGG